MQCVCYYSKYIKEQLNFSCPCIFLILSGPNISIVGIVNGKSFVFVENLVPTLRLALIPGSHITNSLCFCFKALKAFISKANQSDASDFPYFTSFKYFNCDATLEYSSRLSRLVYSANMSWMTEEKEVKCKAVIVKFTNTYGDEVHKCMAESGFAPQLIAVHDLPPNWKVVIMDELQNRMDIGKDKYAVVRAAIKILHENGYVHGDLRLSNMFSCTNTESRIAVIDYDWAGKANEAKYPLWMNPACNWPQGASCGGIITVDHDNYWIDRNLT